MKSKDFYMLAALKQAKSTNKDSIPIGCVIVDKKTGDIVSQANNDSQQKHDPFSHAEIKALKNMSTNLGHTYLENYEIFVTVEPCTTCFSLIKSHNITTINFGARNEKYGFSNHLKKEAIPKKMKIEGDILNQESAKLMKDFFKKIRSEKNMGKNGNNISL